MGVLRAHRRLSGMEQNDLAVEREGDEVKKLMRLGTGMESGFCCLVGPGRGVASA